MNLFSGDFTLFFPHEFQIKQQSLIRSHQNATYITSLIYLPYNPTSKVNKLTIFIACEFSCILHSRIGEVHRMIFSLIGRKYRVLRLLPINHIKSTSMKFSSLSSRLVFCLIVELCSRIRYIFPTYHHSSSITYIQKIARVSCLPREKIESGILISDIDKSSKFKVL